MERNEFKFISMPYIEGHSEQLNRILIRYGYLASCRVSNMLNNLYSKSKCNVDKYDNSNLVYKIKL